MVRADPGGSGSMAAIDPQLMAQMNASIKNGGETLVNQGGSNTAGEDLEIYSHALGTALTAPYPAPGMDKVASDFERASSIRPDAWNKGAMLA
jgi:hypothetical protein